MKRAEAVRSVVLNTSQHKSVVQLRREVDPVVDHIFENFISHYNKGITEEHLFGSHEGQ